MRETGYYWVKHNSIWMICHYTEAFSHWDFMGTDWFTNEDIYFEEINETKIEMP